MKEYNLKGSEKQIKWATDILNNFKIAINENINYFGYDSDLKKAAEKVKADWEIVLPKFLEKVDYQASEIINKRYDFTSDTLKGQTTYTSRHMDKKY